ncbi:MAG: hypothetical protein UZ14_CFX002001051 [Chloroflexi bacterium OLB14]|nr:MAG: hypothetical protein UZ14_CFX002001051 [Chloroflexi bacterium OLB14]
MKKYFIYFIVLVIALTACSGSPAQEQSSVETIVAGTLEALTASAPIEPTAVNGISFTDDNISFVIPTGIGTSAVEEIIPAVPAGEGLPWWGTYPEHHIYNLEGYSITDGFRSIAVYLYPIQEYVAMNEDVATRVETLKSLIANPNQPLPEHLPFLPTFNANAYFYSNFATVSFQNGSGIRYLTAFSQVPAPILNNLMLYTFQGITNDGLYYVSATFAVNIGFLVGKTAPTDWPDPVILQNEIDTVTQQLNNSKPESFTPSLLVLDSFVQSINVTGIP